MVLKKTAPEELVKNKAAVDTLAKNSLKQTAFQHLPFEVLQDVGNDNADEKPFLLCAFNHNTTSGTYRSPHTSRLFTVQDGKSVQIAAPKNLSEDDRELRNLEKAMNEVWYAYTALYYGFDSIGSVFLSRPSHTAKLYDSVEHVALNKARGKGYIEGMFGVHKKAADGKSTWDCVHLIQVEEKKDKQCYYRIESAVVMTVCPYGGTRVSSSQQKETIKTLPLRSGTAAAGSHIENLGKIMEDVEMEFRSKLERVDIPKAIDVAESMYFTGRDEITASLVTGIDQSEEPMMTTGMGVGSSMIGQIATMAQQKKADGNAFLDRMKEQQKAREAQMEEQNQDYLAETKSQLKSPLRVPKTPTIPPMSPDFANGKVTLKRTSVPNPPFIPSSPTPEFSDFRNKLKKPGTK